MVKPQNRSDIIEEVKKIYEFFVSKSNFSVLIPEVRTNISCALQNANSKEDVAAIEGRITIIDGYPKTCGDIKFGISDHTARLILTAKSFDNSINCVMNLKYIPELISQLIRKSSLRIVEFHRDSQPKELRKKEYSTMQWLIKNTIDKEGEIPDIIWDIGAIGKEPMMRLFAKNSQDMITKLKQIANFI